MIVSYHTINTIYGLLFSRVLASIQIPSFSGYHSCTEFLFSYNTLVKISQILFDENHSNFSFEPIVTLDDGDENKN